MIRINCNALVEESEKIKLFIETVTELVAYSLHDKGCVSYDLYRSMTNDDRFIIVETWVDEDALKAHQVSEHFKRLVPEMKALATVTTEVFKF